MRNLSNIEDRNFPGNGYYVGYGRGSVWHIYGSNGNWRAYEQGGLEAVITGGTLDAINGELKGELKP